MISGIDWLWIIIALIMDIGAAIAESCHVISSLTDIFIGSKALGYVEAESSMPRILAVVKLMLVRG